MATKYDKPNWYPDADVVAGKEGWLYTKNYNEVLSAIGHLDVKLLAKATASLSNSILPTITGSTVVGSVLTVSNGTWSTTATYTYKWESSTDGTTWSTIADASANTYTLIEGDTDLSIRAIVTATVDTTAVSATSTFNPLK